MKKWAVVSAVMVCCSMAVFSEEINLSALLTSAEKAYIQRMDAGKANEAVALYEKSVAASPSSVEALWKLSRAAWWVGDRSTNNGEKLNKFQQGIDAAKKAIALNPDSADAHFWLGANYGSFGECKGVLKSLFLVKPIRHEMAEVIRIDPHYDSGGAMRVLGVVDYKVPGFAGGSKKRALDELTQALSVDAANCFNQYYLAEYYATVGNKMKAREHLAVLASLTTANDIDRPDLLVMQEDGRALEKTLK